MNTKILPVVALAAVAFQGARAQTTEEPVISVEVVEVPAVKPPAPKIPVGKSSEGSGFTAHLTPEEWTAAGLEKLSAEQRTALDALVAKEMKLARQGNVRGFAGTFISRRSEEERVAAGLGILTTSEKYQLDRLVSRALATTPAQPPMAIARPATNSDVLTTPFKWETHGYVQLEYGWGSDDREYKAGTVAVTQVNPRTGTAFTFAYTVAEGDDLWWNRGYGYDCGWRGRFR